MKKFGYEVNIDYVCTHEEHSPEQWGSWSADYDNRLESVFKSKDCPDIVSSLDIPEGATAYVVWAHYSTGDSFGGATGGGREALGIFQDANAAHELARYLASVHDDEHGVNFETRDGQKHHFPYLPWLGFFEELEDIVVDTITIGKR